MPKKVCNNQKTHLECVERMDNCKVCKVFGGYSKANTHGLRNIAKVLALAIAQENPENDKRAVYGKAICGRCRLVFEAKYHTEEMTMRANIIYG